MKITLDGVVQVVLEFRDTGEQVSVDLPAVPRIGEQVLWTDEATHETHGPYVRMREYRVEMVDWSLSPGTRRPSILVRLVLIEDVSGLPDDTPTG